MKKILTFFNIRLILFLGFSFRLLFLLFGAETYFGKEDFYAATDTYAWLEAFINLIETGSFTVNFDNEFGYFGRIPGYSFILGFFYFLSFKNIELCFQLTTYFQIISDSCCVYLVYLFSKNIYNNQKIALINSLIYACYPFIIVWTSMALAECFGINLLIAGLWLLSLKNIKKVHYFMSGLALAAAALNRPQVFLIMPILGISIYFLSNKKTIPYIYNACFFCLGFLILYAPWPIRNYVNHNRVVLTQDIRGIWQHDKVAFRYFILSIKPEWEPQFSQLNTGKAVDFMHPGFLTKQDSVKLKRAYFLIQNCGFGYNYVRDHLDPEIKRYSEPLPFDCSQEIITILNEVRISQISNNPLNYYLIVPLYNLKKAFFKSALVGTNKSIVAKVAVLLFSYRTLLLLLGLAGILWIMFSKKFTGNKIFFAIILGYFSLFYLLVSAGDPTLQFRNIEIRYFLPPDILMLFPVGFLVFSVNNLFKLKDTAS